MGWQPALIETDIQLYFFEYSQLAIFMVDGGHQGNELDECTKLFVIVIDCLIPLFNEEIQLIEMVSNDIMIRDHL